MATQESTLRVGVDSRPMVDGAKRGEKALGKLGSKGVKLGTIFDTLNSKTSLLSKAFAVMVTIGIATFFVSATSAAGGFETKMAEISTLVDTTVFKMIALEDALKRQAVEFGQSPIEQAAAAYQIISAGAGSAAAATDLLTSSNKLAIGGVTSVAIAADGLTSVLNAYGDKVEGATAVSDALFVGMRAGKTTIGELSGSLGKVAPLAAQAGVGFDELVASVAALTKGGISTRESVTGVRAILAAIVKPTKEAKDMAKSLGIEFNSSALEAKGFTEFMGDLVAKTGGSTDAMAQLFGGVEALIPALALAGQAGVDMNAIMADMATKSGATQAAFEKMTNTFEFQSARLRQGLMVALIAVGSVITSALTPAIKFLADNFDALSRFVQVAAIGFTAAMIPALISSIPLIVTVTTKLVAMAAAFLLTPFGMISALILGAAAALAYFGDITVTVGRNQMTVWAAVQTAVSVVWDLIREGATIVSEVFATSTAAVGGFFSTVLNWVAGFSSDWSATFESVGEIIKSAVNIWIGLHIGFIRAVAAVVTKGIPAMFKLAMGLAQNVVIDALQFIVNLYVSSFAALGDALGKIPGVADDLGDSIRKALDVDMSELRANTVALQTEFNLAGASIKDAFSSAQVDYVGALGDAVGAAGDNLEERFNDKLRDMNEELVMSQSLLPAVASATTAVIPTVEGLGDAATLSADALAKLNKEIAAFTSGIDQEFAAIMEAQGGAVAGVEAWYAATVAKLQDLGLEHTNYAGMVETIFTNRVAAAYKTDLSNATDWRSGIERAVQGLGESIGNEADLGEMALTSMFDNAAAAIVDFAKTGTLDFKKFATSVAADILMMTTKMLLLGAIKTALGMSEGGLVPGLADGGLFAPKGYASGGKVFGPGTTTSDSINAKLSQGEFVVNAAATKDNLGLLTAINSGAKPVAAAQDEQSDGADSVTIVNVFDMSIVGKYLDTPDGRRAIVNVMKEEGLV